MKSIFWLFFSEGPSKHAMKKLAFWPTSRNKPQTLKTRLFPSKLTIEIKIILPHKKHTIASLTACLYCNLSSNPSTFCCLLQHPYDIQRGGTKQSPGRNTFQPCFRPMEGTLRLENAAPCCVSDPRNSNRRFRCVTDTHTEIENPFSCQTMLHKYKNPLFRSPIRPPYALAVTLYFHAFPGNLSLQRSYGLINEAFRWSSHADCSLPS